MSVQSVMQKMGYTYHCGKDGRPCYHRQLHDPPFPRFHAYVSEENGRVEIELHFDADDIVDRQGNHDQPWAYEGGRVEVEMQRINDILAGRPAAHGAGIERLQKKGETKYTAKNWIDLLFR